MANYAKDIIDIDIPALVARIRELEAELQVRDDMGDEVLRILREATGKRDFHSKMEAAEWAARMILDLQTQLFLEKQSAKEAMSREAAAVSREIGARAELAEARRDAVRLDWLQHKGTTNIEADVQDRFGIDLDSDEYPKHKNLRAAIDAAMEEAK